MRYSIVSITVLFLLELVEGTDICHVGPSHRQAIRGSCPRGGCAVVSYRGTGSSGIAEYKCLSDLHQHHPAFVTLACSHSTVDATCYDQTSYDPLPVNVRRLGVREQTFGEVLRNSGIDRFCCCRGPYCNSANQHIKRHFQLSVEDRYAPEEEEDERPRHHPHSHGGEYRSSGTSTAFFSTTLMVLMLRVFI